MSGCLQQRALESAAGFSSKCMRWLWWQIRTNARNTPIKIKRSATKSMMQLSEVKPYNEMKTESVQAHLHSAFMPKRGVHEIFVDTLLCDASVCRHNRSVRVRCKN